MFRVFHLLWVTSLFVFSVPAIGKGQCTADFELIYSDVGRFESMVEDWQLMSVKKQREAVSYYIENGSDGLKAFYSIKIKSIDTLLDAINQNLDYYQALAAYKLDLRQHFSPIVKRLSTIEQFGAPVCPKTVYLLVAALRSAGTVKSDKVLIGIEHLALDPGAIPSKKLMTLEHMKLAVAHEYVHSYQRQAGNAWLIRGAIFEGGAEYIGEQISGISPSNKTRHKFGVANYSKIKHAFLRQMKSTDYSWWLANKGSHDWPADLGYFVGYEISRKYMEQASDKSKAFVDLMTVTQPILMLEKSGY